MGPTTDAFKSLLKLYGIVTKYIHILRTCLFLAVFLLASAGWVAALDPTHRISQYGHTAWRIRDGYFGAAPASITQTADGYIWVGTEAGLFRFDGLRIVPWSAQSGEQLPSANIASLLAANDGSLWIGTENGLAQWLHNHLTTYLKGEGWTITSIIEDSTGRIWIHRYRGGDYSRSLCQVVDTAVRCYGSEDGVPPLGPGSLVQDSSGNLWAGSSTTLLRWRPGASKVYKPAALQSHEGIDGVDALLAATDGSLWVGIAQAGRGLGLQHMVDGVLQSFIVPRFNGETVEVYALLNDHQNNLWVGTSHGIYRIHGSDVDHCGSADGLSGDDVTTILEDREGNLWVGTSAGIDMFRDLRVSSFSTREGLRDDGVDSVLASRDGTIWIGNGSHLEVLGPDGVSSQPGETLQGHQVTYLLEDHNGRLWVGMDNTLSIYQSGKFSQIKKQDGSPLGMVMGLTEDSEHNIWAEIHGPPAMLIRIQDLKVREEFPAPPMPLARKLASDPQSGIWLGLVNGDLARFRSGKTETFSFPGHPNVRVKALTAVSDGSILGATAFGVVGWKNGKQQILTVRNGLPCDDINAAISDDQGDLWLNASCGLIEIAKDEVQRWWGQPESRVNPKLFDLSDGAQPGLGHFATSAKTPDGRLWFASGSVLQMVDPSHLAGNAIPPPVDINGIVADRKNYSLQGSPRLPPLTRDLEIDYTALSFAVPQKVLFRYMLEGHDAGWQEPGTRRQAFYNDLGPGHYRFHVIASNNDGVWNQAGAFLDFSILPAYYQTAWFRALCVAAFLLLLWFIYRMRVRQVARAMSIRFDERLSERTRIARDFHDTYLQTIQGSRLVADSALKQSPDFARMRGALEQLSVWLGRATEEGRAALSSLRTSATEKNDLAEAFQRAIEECRINSSMEGSLTVAGEVSEMHPIVRDEVYRIGYEAIRNACVHSQATNLRVELAYADDLILRVRDNGVGINAAIVDEGKQEHFGLQGMRERARRIMAKFTVNTSPGSGTEITLVVPGSIIYRTTNSRGRKWPAIESLLKRMGLRSNSTDS